MAALTSSLARLVRRTTPWASCFIVLAACTPAPAATEPVAATAPETEPGDDGPVPSSAAQTDPPPAAKPQPTSAPGLDVPEPRATAEFSPDARAPAPAAESAAKAPGPEEWKRATASCRTHPPPRPEGSTRDTMAHVRSQRFVKECFIRHTTGDPDGGKMVVHFFVLADGCAEIEKVEAEGNLRPIAACIAEGIARTRFPPPDDPPARVSYPIVFGPG